MNGTSAAIHKIQIKGIMVFAIAIDGHAASGKGTVAKGVAKFFGYSYLDTGLIYRALAQIALSKDRVKFSKKDLINVARSFRPEYLDLKNLRSDEVGNYASEIARYPEVRFELIKFQRNFVKESNGAVLDGRDIGTIILPNAQLKVFVTADLNIRARRRYNELYQKDKSIIFEKVLADLSKRDQQDSEREYAPLKISNDAHLIDTSELSIEASIAYVVNLVNSIKGKI